MGILGNFSVYGLMVLPLAMLVRGKNISLSRLYILIVLCVCVQFAESILLASVAGVAGDSAIPAMVLRATLLPLIEVAFFSFALNDSRAVKVLRLVDATEVEGAENVSDTPTVVAVAWCLCQVVFFRWGDWYRSMSSLGFEAANLASGADAFLQLLATLSACRLLSASGGSSSIAALLVAAQAAAAGGAVVAGQLASRAVVSVALYVVGPAIAGNVDQKKAKTA